MITLLFIYYFNSVSLPLPSNHKEAMVLFNFISRKKASFPQISNVEKVNCSNRQDNQ